MKYLKYFSEYLTLNPNTIQQKVLCPFHEDREASLSVNLEKGVYYCHACGVRGDVFKWYMHWNKCDFNKAKVEILGDARVSVLSESEAEEAHKLILSKSHLIRAISYKRGWTIDTIKRFQLGWNEKEERVYIPIRNEEGELINIRKYDLFHKKKKNKFLGVRGHNTPYLFPIKNLIENETVMLMAGEPDTILACQLNMVAVTVTGGEGAVPKNLMPKFKDKTVYVCYDCDVAGVRGSRAIANELIKYATKVMIIELPFGG